MFAASTQVLTAVRFAIVNSKSAAAVEESTAVGCAITVAVRLSPVARAALPDVPSAVSVTGMKPQFEPTTVSDGMVLMLAA
jgi:hypothetical protein